MPSPVQHKLENEKLQPEQDWNAIIKETIILIIMIIIIIIITILL